MLCKLNSWLECIKILPFQCDLLEKRKDGIFKELINPHLTWIWIEMRMAIVRLNRFKNFFIHSFLVKSSEIPKLTTLFFSIHTRTSLKRTASIFPHITRYHSFTVSCIIWTCEFFYSCFSIILVHLFTYRNI